jgi:hypothetical protein
MTNDISSNGMFVPLINIWDVQQIQSSNINSQEFKELLVRLYQNINQMAIALNLKDTGYYPQSEFVTSKLLFPNVTSDNQNYRSVFRTTINFGSLPNTSTKSVAHHIPISTTIPTTIEFLNIYGSASNPDQTSFLPIPFASPTLNENIKLSVTNTNIVITTAIDYSAYNGIVVLEYIKF